MIELTRLNGNLVMVNSDLIQHAEAIPDTTLTLVHGDKLVVLESCSEVRDRMLQFRARVMQAAWAGTEAASSMSSPTAATPNL